MKNVEKIFFKLYSFDYTEETICDILALDEKEFKELQEISEKRLDKMFPVCYN